MSPVATLETVTSTARPSVDERRTDDRPLRIAVIGARGLPSNYSGIERVCDSLYSLLAARGHQITMYCRPDHLAASRGEYRGIRLIRTRALRLGPVETLSHAVTSLRHALRQEDYDLIHLHALAPGLLSPFCRLRGKPTIATVHGLDWQRAKWKGLGARVLRLAERMLVRYADELIVLSHDLQEYFRTTYGRRTVRIPNGVERTGPSAGNGAAQLEPLGLAPGEYIVYVGRLVPEKRVQDLIAAVGTLDTQLKLAIVGEGGYTDAYVRGLRQAAADNPRVVFTGLQRGETLQALFRGAAMFVSPSELEGLPMSLLECMEHGTPAVVSDIPPHRELLGGRVGYDLFFPPGDVAALADRLRQVLAKPQHYRQVAARTQEYVRAEFSWSTVADRTEEVYRAVLAGKPTPT